MAKSKINYNDRTLRKKDGKVLTNYFSYQVVREYQNEIVIEEKCLIEPHKDKKPNYIYEKQSNFTTLFDWVDDNGCWWLD